VGIFPTSRPCYVCATSRTEPIPNAPSDDRLRPPPPDLLLRPLARLLRPLVRLLIQSGVTFPVLADLLRGLYVDVATRDLLPNLKARTDSRVSLLTGVHRKELRRQRALEAADAAEPAAVTRTSAIVARWLGAPAYTDATTRRPLSLPRSGPGPSFEGLVAAVTRDVRPRAVLDDLLDQGIVSVNQEGRIRLNAEAFIPRPGRDEQFFYFARNLHDHLAAAAANVLAAPGTAPFLDRSVHYDGLGAEAAARLEAAAREAAQRLLMDINRLALELVEAQEAGDRPAAPGSAPGRRVNLGVYLYAEDEPPAADAGA